MEGQAVHYSETQRLLPAPSGSFFMGYVMGKRYVVRSQDREYWDDGQFMEGGGTPDLTVFENEDTPIATGLLDVDGNELFRVEDRQPIGFAIPTVEKDHGF
jgi:hypothetical protein